MTVRSSQAMLRHIHRLFNVGTVGTMTDAQLLHWFVCQSDDAREAAFEELMNRHGPMVFRVCRSVLQDAHDAEDAFQAAFLVLANRARSIRRRESVASWLFGVAHRVASQARSRAAHRRGRDQEAASQKSESQQTSQRDGDWELLHDEIRRLPECLQAPLVLCYLEGLTYHEAARQLGLSDGTLRSRLARARRKLRARLTRRGVSVPVGLIVAGAAGGARASIALPLVQSTVRIAFGFNAGQAASELARGIVKSMLMNRIKSTAIVILVAITSGYWAWHSAGAASDDNVQTGPNQPATAIYRLTGSVSVEGTNQPVAMARLPIFFGDFYDESAPRPKFAETDLEGRFTVPIPAGPFRIGSLNPPAGYYWVLSDSRPMESLFAGPDEPEVHVNYRVRSGTKWDFRFARGADQKPAPGFVDVRQRANTGERCHGGADARGQLHLTLPTERRSALAIIRESPLFGSQLDTGWISLSMDWDSDFRPDAIHEITPLNGNGRRFRLIDVNEKSATLEADGPIEPLNHNGRLIIHVAMPHRDASDYGAITGQVLDRDSRPIAGAFAGLAQTDGGSHVSEQLRHQSTTNAQGWYRLRDIPRRTLNGTPLQPRIVLAKEGYAGHVSEPLVLKDVGNEKFQVADPIHLERHVTLQGVVVDHRGEPVAGAWVRSTKPIRYGGLTQGLPAARTDENGRFLLQNLQRRATELSATDGRAWKRIYCLNVGSSQPVCLQLPERRPRDLDNRAANPRDFTDAEPVRLNQTAPEWRVRKWSDAQVRTLADDRGKVVVLYFWGFDFRQSVEALPALGKLAAAFEPRGVVFRAIHHPDENDGRIEEHARTMLRDHDKTLALAFDQLRIDHSSRGVTADRFGVNNYPVIIVIDRSGTVAFRSDSTTGDRNVSALFLKTLTQPEVMTRDRANRAVECAIAAEIELAVRQVD